MAQPRYLMRHYADMAAFEDDANKQDGYGIHSWQPQLEQTHDKNGAHVYVGYHVIYQLTNPAPKEKEPMACR